MKKIAILLFFLIVTNNFILSQNTIGPVRMVWIDSLNTTSIDTNQITIISPVIDISGTANNNYFLTHDKDNWLRDWIDFANQNNKDIIPTIRSIEAGTGNPDYLRNQTRNIIDSMDLAIPPNPNTIADGIINEIVQMKQNFDINADKAWDITKGDPEVLIAVIEGSGFDLDHPDLEDNYSDLRKNIDDDNDNPDIDINELGVGNSHGTMVAGVICAIDNNDNAEIKSVVGVAPNCKIVMIEARGEYNQISAFKYFIFNKLNEKANIRIVNMSIGHDPLLSEYIDIWPGVLSEAYSKGLILIAAAGNEPKILENHPAEDPNVIGVSGTKKNGYWYEQTSTYKDAVELAAPSKNIWSTKYNDDYGYDHGTSLATPIVSGIAALIVSKYPHLSNKDVRRILHGSCNNLGQPGFKDGPDDLGWGRVDAFKALAPPRVLKIELSQNNNNIFSDGDLDGDNIINKYDKNIDDDNFNNNDDLNDDGDNFPDNPDPNDDTDPNYDKDNDDDGILNSQDSSKSAYSFPAINELNVKVLFNESMLLENFGGVDPYVSLVGSLGRKINLRGKNDNSDWNTVSLSNDCWHGNTFLREDDLNELIGYCALEISGSHDMANLPVTWDYKWDKQYKEAYTPGEAKPPSYRYVFTIPGFMTVLPDPDSALTRSRIFYPEDNNIPIVKGKIKIVGEGLKLFDENLDVNDIRNKSSIKDAYLDFKNNQGQDVKIDVEMSKGSTPEGIKRMWYIWDTTEAEFPDGIYHVTLRALDKNGNQIFVFAREVRVGNAVEGFRKYVVPPIVRKIEVFQKDNSEYKSKYEYEWYDYSETERKIKKKINGKPTGSPDDAALNIEKSVKIKVAFSDIMDKDPIKPLLRFVKEDGQYIMNKNNTNLPVEISPKFEEGATSLESYRTYNLINNSYEIWEFNLTPQNWIESMFDTPEDFKKVSYLQIMAFKEDSDNSANGRAIDIHPESPSWYDYDSGSTKDWEHSFSLPDYNKEYIFKFNPESGDLDGLKLKSTDSFDIIAKLWKGYETFKIKDEIVKVEATFSDRGIDQEKSAYIEFAGKVAMPLTNSDLNNGWQKIGDEKYIWKGRIDLTDIWTNINSGDIHTINVRATNLAGLVCSDDAYRVVVDKNGPTLLSFLLDWLTGGADLTKGRSDIFNLNASDDVSDELSFEVAFRDDAGNKVRSWQFVFDWTNKRLISGQTNDINIGGDGKLTFNWTGMADLLATAIQGGIHIDISVKDEAGNVTRNSGLNFSVFTEQLEELASQLNQNLMSLLGDVTKRVVIVDSSFSKGGLEWGALKKFFSGNNIDYRKVAASSGEQWESMDKQVETVKRTIDDYVKSDKEQVVIVGWGAGGLVAKEYIRKHHGDNKVSKFVTLGSPNSGINSFGQVPQGFAVYLCLAPVINFLSKTKFIESGENDIQAKLYSSDIYGYHYLNQYVYEIVTNVSQNTNIPRQIYMGYEIINKEKVPRAKVYYNKHKGVVEEYSIIGNAIIPSVKVKYNYKKINGLLLPVQILTRVNYQMGQSDCLIRLRNQQVNEGIDSQVFSP